MPAQLKKKLNGYIWECSNTQPVYYVALGAQGHQKCKDMKPCMHGSSSNPDPLMRLLRYTQGTVGALKTQSFPCGCPIIVSGRAKAKKYFQSRLQLIVNFSKCRAIQKPKTIRFLFSAYMATLCNTLFLTSKNFSDGLTSSNEWCPTSSLPGWGRRCWRCCKQKTWWHGPLQDTHNDLNTFGKYLGGKQKDIIPVRRTFAP